MLQVPVSGESLRVWKKCTRDWFRDGLGSFWQSSEVVIVDTCSQRDKCNNWHRTHGLWWPLWLTITVMQLLSALNLVQAPWAVEQPNGPIHVLAGSSSCSVNRLGLSHWHPYAVQRGGCIELYYCNMVEWFWWDSSLILTTNWFPSVLWDCWFGHLTCKNHPQNDLCVEWDVRPLHYYYSKSCLDGIKCTKTL